MKKIELEIDDATARTLGELIDLSASEFNTHGPLTIHSLLLMLIEDLCLAMERPGSWEGSNMANVMLGHGYGV